MSILTIIVVWAVLGVWVATAFAKVAKTDDYPKVPGDKNG